MVALFLIVLISVIPFYIIVPLWINKSKNFMKESILKTSEIRTKSLGNYIDTFFKQVRIDIEQIHNYTKNIFNNELPIKKYYRSYYSTYSVDPLESPVDSKNYYLASTNFKLGINNYNDFLNLQYVNETSIIDNIFRSVYKNNNMYIKMYIGLNNGLFRRYPYARLEDYSTLSYICANNQLSVIGYDPRCRIWYQQSLNNEDIKFTPPYKDAFSKKMHLSISKGIILNTNPTPFLGVIAADFSMELLDKLVLDTKIVDNAITFLVDESGLVISYPNLNRNINNPMIWDIDKRLNIQQWKSLLNDNNSLKTSIYNTDNTYYLTCYKIPDVSYKLFMTFKENDLYSEPNNLSLSITIILVVGTIILLIVVTVIIVIILIANILLTKRYTSPFTELTKVLDQMTKSNLEISLGNKPAISSELKMVHENFENLLIAVKFGNEAYYNGDLKKALENYDLAEKLMIKLNNNKGLGVCFNNKANVYKQLQDIPSSINLYNKSIDNIKEILKKSSNRIADNITLANRLMNLAIALNDSNDYIKSESLFKESISLNKECDNSLGMAKASGNLGQLYIKQNKLIEAENIIYEAYNIIKNKDDIRSLQYMILNIGILEFHKNNFEETIKWLTYNLTNFEKLDIYIQRSCLQYLLKTYECLNNHDMIIRINSLLVEPRNVYFVLDCSGSMDGNPLEKCKKSILDIINNNLTDYDNISIITFNTNYRVVIPLTKKYMVQNINQIIMNIKAGGHTAFYSAVNAALDGANKNAKDWIVALTDGEDNSSIINPNILIEKISKSSSNIIVITIGNLSNENIIKKMCTANNNGNHIRIGINNIEEAFHKVAQMIVGQVNVEVL